MKIIDEQGDGADRRRRRIRLVERYIKRSGKAGLSSDEIKSIAAYDTGLTGKKVVEIIRILRKLGKVHMNEKRRWVSI